MSFDMNPRDEEQPTKEEWLEAENDRLTNLTSEQLRDAMDAQSTIERLTKERDAAQAACAVQRGYFEYILEYWNRDDNDRAMNDALHHNLEVAEKALADPNPGDSLMVELTSLRAYRLKLPADWFEDSSLETWFPLTAEELKHIKEERDKAEQSRQILSDLTYKLEASRNRFENRVLALEKLIKRIDRELTDGEQGPSETICKMAEIMEEFARLEPITQ